MRAQSLASILISTSRLIRLSGQTLAWLNLLMVAGTLAIVILRYAFATSLPALQEGVMYVHAIIFMLGMAFTMEMDEHVRVDIVYQRLSAKGKAWVNIAGGLTLLLPMMIYIGWESLDYVALSWQSRETSQEAGGLPYVYLLKTLIPVMVGMLVIQVVLDISRQGFFILSGQTPEASLQTHQEQVEHG